MFICTITIDDISNGIHDLILKREMRHLNFRIKTKECKENYEKRSHGQIRTD